jgi:hypothetical protein
LLSGSLTRDRMAANTSRLVSDKPICGVDSAINTPKHEGKCHKGCGEKAEENCKWIHRNRNITSGMKATLICKRRLSVHTASGAAEKKRVSARLVQN